MSKPAAKRLLDIIKRKRLKSKFTKLLPVGKFGAGGGYKKAVGAASASSFVPDLALTCLIQVNTKYCFENMVAKIKILNKYFL